MEKLADSYFGYRQIEFGTILQNSRRYSKIDKYTNSWGILRVRPIYIILSVSADISVSGDISVSADNEIHYWYRYGFYFILFYSRLIFDFNNQVKYTTVFPFPQNPSYRYRYWYRLI